MFSRTTNPLQFPIYLLPSIPFYRRKTSTHSPEFLRTPHDGDGTSTRIPRSNEIFQGYGSHLRCARCSVDICLTSQIISKGFTGRHGRAYLVSPASLQSLNTTVMQDSSGASLPNTRTDTPSQRQLVTGVHTVCDVRCLFCNSMLGWKYEGAEEDSQRYKVGKYILETKMVCPSSDWNVECAENLPSSSTSQQKVGSVGKDLEDIEFDSQDEEECEDLFAGIWSPSLASRRRQGKRVEKVGSVPKS